jgi:hypothetical protein
VKKNKPAASGKGKGKGKEKALLRDESSSEAESGSSTEPGSPDDGMQPSTNGDGDDRSLGRQDSEDSE